MGKSHLYETKVAVYLGWDWAPSVGKLQAIEERFVDYQKDDAVVGDPIEGREP